MRTSAEARFDKRLVEIARWVSQPNSATVYKNPTIYIAAILWLQ